MLFRSLGEQLRFEIEPGREAEIGVGGTREAVDAAVLAAAIGIDRGSKPMSGESLRAMMVRVASGVTVVRSGGRSSSSTGACKGGWDDILRQQLDIRFRPCNFAELMPRLNEGKIPRSG